MATLLERFALHGNEILRQRMTAAIADKALRVFQAGGSTAQQKQEALARLRRRTLSDNEWAMLSAVFGASGGFGDSQDTDIQAIADTAYAGLPNP